MDASKSRATALAAGIFLLAEAAWLLRPEPILPRLEPGLGAPPAAGRPAPGLPDEGVGAGTAGADGHSPSPEDAADDDEDLRDAPADAAPTAARVERAGPPLDADGDIGPTRAQARLDGRTPAGATDLRRATSRAPSSRAAAVGERNAAAAAARLAAEYAARARRRSSWSDARIAAARLPGIASAARALDAARRAEALRERRADSARGGRASGASAGGRTDRAASLFDPSYTSDSESRKRDGARTRARRGRGRGRSARPRAQHHGARRERPEEKMRTRRPGPERRFKPLLLGSALGPKALRPPPASLEPPAALLNLPERRPELGPDGRPTPAAPADLAAVENLDPRSPAGDRRGGPHWEAGQWRDGPARGIEVGGAWLWTYRSGARVWALAGDPAAPLLRRGGVWWMKSEGMWFVVHDGEPWALRDFNDWGARGLFQPATGSQIVYSADYSRAAVITPGQGAEVFDARTGALIGTIPEDRMPPTRRPKPPQSLPVPQ